MKTIIILLALSILVSATKGPCLPVSGNHRPETHAQRARKELSKFGDNMEEQLRKNDMRQQPHPNLYVYQDDNCVGNGEDPSKRDRKMRRG